MRFNPIQILGFLQAGAFVKWDEEHWLIGWSPCCKPVQAGPSWVLGEFYEPATAGYFESHALVKTSDFLEDLQSSGPDLDFGTTRTWKDPTRSSFDAQMELIFEGMSSGELEKAVPVIYEKSSDEFSNPEKLKVLIHLLKTPSTQNAYGHWRDGSGVIGLTPELLFEVEKDILKTVALAGTRSKDSKLSLLTDAKEMKEHQLVIDRIQDQLNSFGDLSLSETYEAEFKNIVHLKTDITLKLDDELDILKMVDLMHPTPALGVHSQQVGHHWLKKLDKHSEIKKFFGAPVGVSFNNRTRMLVGIRNIQWFNGQTFLGSGCGIVEQSLPDKEWEELKLKRKVVKENLGLL